MRRRRSRGTDLRDGVEIFGEDFPSPSQDAMILTMDGVTTV